MAKDGKCHCIVCDRPFDYGDVWSPMLKDNIWAEIIKHYNLIDVEKSNEVLFNYYYDLYQQNYGSKYGWKCWDKAGDYQTFICYPCMEKALGRQLTYDDLIGKDVPLNKEFEEKVLNPRLEK